MRNQELLNRSLNILTEAYLNNTLVAGNCAACAVGNLVAGNTDQCVVMNHAVGMLGWSDSLRGPMRWFSAVKQYRGEYVPKDLMVDFYERRHIEESTGYTMAELSMIEQAFEDGSKVGGEYGGLEQVYETLLEIHAVKNTDLLPECAFAPAKVKAVASSPSKIDMQELVNSLCVELV